MNNHSQPTAQNAQRIVRVFISSTFQDMHAERDELVKHVFPKLRRRCRERRVEFVDVDLRWGITEEQAERGEALPICLAEIERCRPYFIGLLGERYGWVPEDIDKELIQTQPWLTEHLEHSITELEIYHGVLNDENMQGLAYFYLRNPDASKQIEAELAKQTNYQAEPQSTSEKLQRLKQKINTSGYTVTENYPDAKTLGQIILDDLWAAIDQRFPESKIPSALEQERLEHQAFATTRTKVYIGRQEYFEILDAHVNSDSPPMVLLGESGSGKSALLSNWTYRYLEQHPDDFMLLHFIGGTPDSADYVQLLRRIMLEIKERYEPARDMEIPSHLAEEGQGQGEIPADPQKLIEAFPTWLSKATGKGKFILILDGLNQLEDSDNAPDLIWLPQFIPPNIRLIVSTLPGRSLDALQKRDWPNLTIEPLDTQEHSKERSTLITEYLKQFSKTLDKEQIEKITAAPQTTNPLYLKTLLDELRVFGNHEQLNEHINHYLQANTINALFDKMLARLEQDYEREQPGLTKKIMSLIWASRHGLAESELLELLKIPQAIWSPLYLATEESLVNRSGLLNFFHNFLRQAVEGRYLKDSETKQKTHLVLADYFQERELDERKADELPWQLEHAQDWERLKDCITQPEILLWHFDKQAQFELTHYWLSLENRFDMAECYNTAILEYESTIPDKRNFSNLLSTSARFLYFNGKIDSAEPLMRRALAIDENIYGPTDIQVARGSNNLALILGATGRLVSAEALLRQSLAIIETTYGTEQSEVATRLNNLAQTLVLMNRHAEAEPLYRRALAIRETIYGLNHPDLSNGLSGLAVLLINTNQHAEAETLLHRALAIEESAYGPNHPYVAHHLNNLASLLGSTNRSAEAEPLLRRALAIAKVFYGENDFIVATNLNNLADLLHDTNQMAEAESLYGQALAIVQSIDPNHDRIAPLLERLADIRSLNSDDAAAESLFRRALQINEANHGPDDPSVAGNLNRIASLLQDANRLREAEPLYRRALKIDEATYGPEHPNVTRDLNDLSSLLKATHRFTEAEPLLRRALEIDEVTFGTEHQSIVHDLNNLASLLCNTDRLEEAKSHYQRAVVICNNIFGTNHSLTILISDELKGCEQAIEKEKTITDEKKLKEAVKALMQAYEYLAKKHKVTGQPAPASDWENLRPKMKSVITELMRSYRAVRNIPHTPAKIEELRNCIIGNLKQLSIPEALWPDDL